jgi:hypothetical protein
MVDSLRFAARVAASDYVLRAHAQRHEKPTTVRFSLGYCTLGVFRPLRWHPRFAFVPQALPFGVLVFSLASAFCLRASGVAIRRFGLFAGIRLMLLVRKRCPCAGRHLLFFAAAKKSRQKKAAHTASSCVCLRAPNGSYASHGNALVRVRCQRSLCTPHPLHAPALQPAVPDSPRPPRWQTVCRPLVRRTPHSGPIAHASHLWERHAIRRDNLHTVCHLGGANHSLPLAQVGYSKRVRRSFEAWATGTSQGTVV